MSAQLASKVAVVTGAGSGIGEAIAVALHAAGAQVVLVDISGRQEDVAKSLGERAVAVHADVSHGADVERMLDAASASFGGLHILCNNAGIEGELAPLGDCSEENFDRVISVNLRGVFLGMRHAIPRMLANGGGSIVNTASIAGSVAFPTMSPYCASKGAILAMSRTAAAEYAAAGIRINCIAPGVIATSMVDRLPGELVSGATALTPMGRSARPDEVAAAVVYLAGDSASFVTGSVITLDGGYSAL